MSEALTSDIINILDKEEISAPERNVLVSTIMLDADFEEHVEKYIKHGILDEFCGKILTMSLSDEAISILISRERIERKFLTIFTALILKNYRQLVKELYTILSKASKEELLDHINSPLFEDEYFVFLCRLLVNSERFLKIIVDNNKFNNKTAEIFSTASNVNVLSLVFNNAHVCEDKKLVFELLLKNPYLPEELKAQSGQKIEEHYAEPQKKVRELEENLYQMIKTMSMAKKVKLAMKGNKSARALLIKDSNKQVSGAVLNNPQITIDEIDFISKNKNTAEHIFRGIARNSEWMAEYAIVRAMVFNSKAPLDITISLLYRLNIKDVEEIARSRDVPANLRAMAKRIFENKMKSKH